ncbi:MAG: glycosyltransferase family 39 protein [Armatimonadota bacterium]|nr:glycosyltransferase family 39 protein [Armatimonadota bacterium]MDR7444017.1 glycosyltransferase family 39 protein [Armatimonadota bacterium]MDR7570923.1 glycosyltransferase family 39 protein [Armatimonadota bacterium]MDR7615380.1 glycosyltransferase family 39 protein [Armatimonadota bacterium]
MRRALHAGVVLSLVLLFWRLGSSPFWDQDEAKYAGIAREILRTGDWITLHWNGEPWFVHPPLYFWLLAATGKWLGVTEFVARFWSAVPGALGVGVTGLLGRELFGPGCGLLSAFVLATTLQWWAQARLAVFDPLLVLWMLLSLFGFWRGYARGERGAYLLAFVAAGLGTLTKGFVAAVVPGAVGLLFLALRRELGRLREVPWFPGLLSYAVLGCGWYAVQAVLHGEPFLRTALGYYTLNRYVGVVEGQSGPVWYYVPVLILGLVPWTAFLVRACSEAVRARTDPRPLFLLTWLGFGFAFFSLAGTKLPNYVLGLYPSAAILIGRVLEAGVFGEEEGALRDGWRLLLGLCALFTAAVAIYGFLLYPFQTRTLVPALIPPVGALVVGGGIASWLGLRGSAGPAVLALGGSSLLFFALATGITLPQVDRYRHGPELGRTVASVVRPGDVRIGYRTTNSLITYSGLHWRYAEDGASLREMLCAVPSRRRAVVVVPERFYDPGLFSGLRVVRQVGNHLVLEKPAGKPTPRCVSSRSQSTRG